MQIGAAAINHTGKRRAPPLRTLGACNRGLAREALELEDKVGTTLPCNVMRQEATDNTAEIATIDPVALMAAIENPRSPS
jgi:uncharacterized protein (DUF302 family)